MPTIHSRGEVFGDQVPRSMSGAMRAFLAPGLRILTVHHGGAGAFGDYGDTPTELLAIQEYASSPAKATPWEYNWVIDTAGEIWEYAGGYQAAHSLGSNSAAIGVLLLINSLVEKPTQAMLDSLRWLRHYLQEKGSLSADVQTLQHGEMPYVNTGCPGPLVKAVWSEILTPWQPTPAPTPPPAAGDDMARFVVVGQKENLADPQRWLWDGMRMRRLIHEADYDRVRTLWQTSYTLADPFRMPIADIRALGG